MDTTLTGIASIAGNNVTQDIDASQIEDMTPNVVTEQARDSDALASEPKVVSKYAHLEPMGACWFCHKQVDSVRRFCSKACSQDFDNEIDGY
jgi:hypothetical protein